MNAISIGSVLGVGTTLKISPQRRRKQFWKKITEVSSQAYKTEDFDFGEEQPDNIQILKNISHAVEGYYLIVAVHREIEKRDDFVTKVIASGQADVDFFYDTNTSKYYIYFHKMLFFVYKTK